MGTAIEKQRKDSLQHLMSVEYILSTVLHQVLDTNIGKILTSINHVRDSGQLLYDFNTIWQETFEVENFHGSVSTEHFCRENFRRILNQSWVGMARPKFCGENFCGWPSNREIHERFHPRKFSTIRYI